MSNDPETRAQVAAMIRRVRLADIDASGPQHIIRGTGLKGEEVLAPRVKDFGFSSSPPPGSVGLLAALGGRSDRAMLFGLDHADYGPRDLAVGHTAIYDAFGNIVSLVQSEIRIVSATKITLRAPAVTIDSPVIKLGSDGAAMPAAMQGTTDTGGFADITNLSTRVLIE
ncbi:hypothetical protein EYW49_20540 [Siculibacillus lacustris]|uniref:Bacteriophage Mu Gp45 N-terminal domain-containing protein n=1 Tax=Siculibacillus lacustris TaxID=1549641 RepID=A0A4Q9VGW3_9HYPH|nr:phage baseplate assembly protein [Siculibacillus lacustris]TBW33350.1 hypothetical protein EYW49_20540 [Siculibacillus lacustris]